MGVELKRLDSPQDVSELLINSDGNPFSIIDEDLNPLAVAYKKGIMHWRILRHPNRRNWSLLVEPAIMAVEICKEPAEHFFEEGATLKPKFFQFNGNLTAVLHSLDGMGYDFVRTPIEKYLGFLSGYTSKDIRQIYSDIFSGQRNKAGKPTHEIYEKFLREKKFRLNEIL